MRPQLIRIPSRLSQIKQHLILSLHIIKPQPSNPAPHIKIQQQTTPMHLAHIETFHIIKPMHKSNLVHIKTLHNTKIMRNRTLAHIKVLCWRIPPNPSKIHNRFRSPNFPTLRHYHSTGINLPGSSGRAKQSNSPGSQALFSARIF